METNLGPASHFPNQTRAPVAHVRVEHHDSLCLLRPRNAEAYEWLVGHTDPDAPWFGQALAVEPRYVADIGAGLREEGFIVR